MEQEAKNNGMMKLLTIQQKLNVPKRRKHKLGYTFRSLEDILVEVKPLLKETNTVLVMQDKLSTGMNEQQLILFTRVMLIDAETGTLIQDGSGIAPISPADKSNTIEQQAGKASSYARKYALNGLFAIDDEVDSDGMGDYRAPQGKPVVQSNVRYAPTGYRAQLFANLNKDNIPPDDFVKMFGYSDFNAVPDKDAEDAIRQYDELVSQYRAMKDAR